MADECFHRLRNEETLGKGRPHLYAWKPGWEELNSSYGTRKPYQPQKDLLPRITAVNSDLLSLRARAH